MEESTRRSRFREEQIVAIRREAERTRVAAAAKRTKGSEQTIYAWRQHYASMEPSDGKKLKALEAQNAKDKPVIEAMRSLSGRDPRYGCRNIRIFLSREGHVKSPGRAERHWRKAKLQLPPKRRWKRISRARPRPLPARAAKHVWAYDFVFDACANGQQLKCLTIVDEFNHECPAIDVAGSIRSSRAIEILARVRGRVSEAFRCVTSCCSEGILVPAV